VKRFNRLDEYVCTDGLEALARATRRDVDAPRPGEAEALGPATTSSEGLGLHRLRGTVRYPEQPSWKGSA
jgi:hypothetical protein